MKSQKLLLVVALIAMFFSVSAQNLTVGSAAYYEAMRIAYQTKIDWVQNNPTEHAMAQESGWYEMANANVQEMTQNRDLAEQSTNGIYLPSNKSMNADPEPGGDLCDLAAPVCTSAGQYTFPCGTSGASAESGPDYGCLGSEPNAAWYYMQVENDGDIIMSLSASADIDFIIWGPFNSTCVDGPVCDYSLLDASHIIDCSYSSTNNETPEIGPGSSEGATTAQAGMFYMFLITNFSGNTQDFTFEQTGGTGSTSCQCMTCGLEAGSLTVNIGDCEPHQDAGNYYSEYDIDGCVNIVDPNDPFIDSIAYFIDGAWFSSQTVAPLTSPNCYSINNLSADGNSHIVTVTMYLSESGVQDTCSQEITYTAPSNCAQCAAVAGPDVTECGETLTMSGSVDGWDTNTNWVSSCSDVNFSDLNSPTTDVNYTGTYTNGVPVNCELIWTITNGDGLTCSDTANVTFQPIPDAAFTLTANACDGTSVFASATNADNIPIQNYDWTFSSATEQTGTLNDNIELLYADTIGNNQVCLQVTSDLGCVSPIVCETTTIKQVPTCDFSIGGSICSDGVTTLVYDNNNDAQIACSGNLAWGISPNITATDDGPCGYVVTATNSSGDIAYYPISLIVTVDGCSSDVCYDSLIVFPQGVSGCCLDPTAYAGPDTSLCILEYDLAATLAGGGNWGYWTQCGGPTATFVPVTAMGDVNTPGDPNAHIVLPSSGVVCLEWHEINGECHDEDQVNITFFEQPNVTFGSDNGYAVCGLTAYPEAISNVVPGTTFEWINNYGGNILISNENVFNPSVTATSSYGKFEFPVVGTVGGQCRDTGYVEVTFIEPPSCDAGNAHSSCGTLDTLHASSTFGGYWTVGSSPAGGTNCSAVFTNHITGEAEFGHLDTNAVVTVTCNGDWVFIWHEVNGQCEAECDVTITFAPNSITLNTLPEERTCFDYRQVDVDTTGYGDDTWLWSVDPNWPYISQVPVLFNQYDPKTTVYRDFTDAAFGDSGHVTIPMIVTLFTGGCASTEPSSVTFYQRPKPYLGRDTMVCDDQIAFDITATVPNADVQWYGSNNPNVVGGTYTANPYDASYTTLINANLGDSLNIVISEENPLGNNHPSCLVRDSILVEFLQRPNPDAGDDEYHNCGNCIQLNANLDNDVNSVGRWLINPEGFYGYGCGDHNDAAVADTNAWFYHSTGINPGVDTVYVVWQEFNSKDDQCYALDSVPVYFWYEDTAYIKLNGNLSLIDSTCGKSYINISGNDNMPTNGYSRGTWWSADGNPIEWYKDGSAGAHNEPQLDSIRITTIGGIAHVWRDIYWVIENGDIYGSGTAPVCRDTSSTIRIRFDNPVEANILEGNSYPAPLINCGDTTCLNAGSIFNWSHFDWMETGYTYYQDGYTGNRADTLVSPCLIAPANVYPNSDTLNRYNEAGLNSAYQRHVLKVHNGRCIAYDTINITWAPIPTGAFNIEQPACSGDAAQLSINRDMLTGLDRYIVDVEWFFENDDEPTSVLPYNPTQDTVDVLWGNSVDNDDFRHGVSVKTINVWGCEYRIYPPDTVIETKPAYIEWVDQEHPVCGECNGLISFRNYSNEEGAPRSYDVKWSSSETMEPQEDDNISASDTIILEGLCPNEFYLQIVTQSAISGGTCNDTMYYNLHIDSTTIAISNYEWLVDTTSLQAPLNLDNTTINNISDNASKYTWQVFNGTEEDIAMLVYEGNDEIPAYVFSNMGEYLVKLQSFNDDAPNCPTSPFSSTIFVHYESVLEVPNVFTPNNDGYNDEFRVKARELQAYQCIIYNRWGQKVFETDNYEESWNGKMMNEGGALSSGAYYYVITGTGKKGQAFEFKGAIQLMHDK